MNGVPGGKTDLPTAISYYRAGRLADAAAICGKILDGEPAHSPTRHLLGVICLQTGQIEPALAHLSHAAREAADNPHILVAYGSALQAAGRLDEAEPNYRLALSIDAGLPDAYNNLASVLLDLNRPEEAVPLLQKALDLKPDYIDALYNLGNAHKACGALQRAIEQYKRTLTLAPDYVDAHTNLGLLLLETHETEAAIEHMKRAVDCSKQAPEQLKNLGNLMLQLNRLDEAEEVYEVLLERFSKDTDTLGRLGEVYRKQHRYDQAEATYRHILEIDGDHIDARVGIADARMDGGDLEGAEAQLHQMLTSGANLTVVHTMLGEISLQLNRVDDADEAFRRAIDAEAGGENSTPSLIMALQRVGGDSALARLEAMLGDASMSKANIAGVHLAIAGICDDRGSVDQAFAHYTAGNDFKSRQSGYHPAQQTQYVDRIVSVYDETFFKRMQHVDIDDDRPVFVVGMPRSGTTLVEQILASHSSIFGAGELAHIGNVAGALRHRAQVPEFFPESALALTSAMASEFTKGYLDTISGLAPGASRIIDKMPGNRYFLGLIALLLPNARIIHCRRNPLDTCLSCYLTNFSREMGFARNLAHLGAYYRDYERLMTHWRQVLPLPILDVQYENLVRDQERVSREIVDFVGLEWEDSCLEFYDTQRRVSTASSRQVRQPIYASSIGRAEAYLAHLTPLIDALGKNS